MRSIRYIHELADWPRFRLDRTGLTGLLAQVRHRQGRLIGRMESLGFPQQQEAVLATLSEDVLKTSEIEGERLDAAQVRSSLARRLGIDIGGLKPVDRHVEGVVEMLLDGTGNYREPLTGERLFNWHAALFPTGRSGMSRIPTGCWREAASDPMQVVSGPVGRERIHFEAPAAARVPGEMAQFLEWFEAPGDEDPVIQAGFAHLWFVTIHPFADGNGRIARAIADLALARSEASPRRFYSMSAQIREERNAYYEILERTQRGGLDVTEWMAWFLGCLDRAIGGAETTLAAVLAKARFWQSLAGVTLHPRQRRMLHLLVDEDWHGKLTTSKWAKLTRCSQDTALRDIEDLVRRGILARNAGGGRSTSYAIATLDPIQDWRPGRATVPASGREIRPVTNDETLFPDDEP